MNKISTYLGISTPALLGRSAVFALAVLALPVLFMQVPDKAEAQVEDSMWRDMAHSFVATGPVPSLTSIAPKTFEFAELQTFTRNHFDLAETQTTKLDCLTTAIYYEARSEPIAGQRAVAQVVLNRVTSRHYPSTVCDVVYQGSTRTTGCQFSFTCDGSMAIKPRAKAWARSRASAVNALLGIDKPTIGRATHYHTVAIRPFWSNTLLRTADVGSHIFYRFPNRREKAAMAKSI